MKKNLILCGEIGCGKSTLIRNALGTDAGRAGGYVTLRCIENGRLVGFDLAPARILTDPSHITEAERFLDFTGKTVKSRDVFGNLGVRLLKEACSCSYAVTDEFGGLELLIPEFSEALICLLSSKVPCIGVIKTDRAKNALIQRVHHEEAYGEKYMELKKYLENDPDTMILYTTGRYDTHAEKFISKWTENFVRM